MRAKVNNLRKSDGFTIIEVLIVLAIAGLIMLIVFLAVPALQRNARNTQRKNDVSAILSAVSEYVSNNNGGLPTASGQFNDAARFASASPKLSYFTTPSKVTYSYATTRSGLATAAPDADTVIVYNYSKCTNGRADATGASIRNIVAVYKVETSGSTQDQCQES